MTATLRFLHVFSTFATGGPQVRFAQIANHLANGNDPPIEHLICAMDDRYDALAKLDSDVVWHQVDAPDTKGSVGKAVSACRRVLKQHAPDLLLTYNWGAIEWSMANLLLGLPEIHFEDGFGPDEANGQLRRRVLTRRLVLRWRARTVLPSKLLLGHAETLWRLPRSRLAYIPNGIDCARFAGDERQRTKRDDGDRVVIGTVAALRKEKNLGRLLSAFAGLPDKANASLTIVGDGPERTALEAKAAELSIADHVTFAGHADRPEEALAGFDIFALSSDTEQMPISLVEAMASCLPIAAVHVGDVADMVADDNRPLIVPADSRALAESMAALIDDPDRRRRLGAANRARALRKFDQGLMFERYAELFEQTMG